jgi:hypothetical protein
MNNKPAFPCEWSKVSYTPGMTMRDYFAAKAMQALCQDQRLSVLSTVGQAYEIADAMMQAREKT